MGRVRRNAKPITIHCPEVSLARNVSHGLRLVGLGHLAKYLDCCVVAATSTPYEITLNRDRIAIAAEVLQETLTEEKRGIDRFQAHR